MQIWNWRQAIEKSKLKPTTKLVLYTLANYMNDHGKGCYPSVVKIAEACGLTERTAYRQINIAVEGGFLVKKKRNLKGKEWASNEYEASYPKGLKLHQSEDMTEESGLTPESPQNDDQGMTPVSIKGCHQCHTNSPVELSSRKDIPDGISKRNSKKQVLKGTRFSPDEILQPDWIDWVIQQYGFDPPDIENEFERFRDYWAAKSGAGATKRDWKATWRNWWRKKTEEQQNRGQYAKQGSTNRTAHDAFAQGAYDWAAGG